MIRRIGVDTCGIERMALAVRRSSDRFLAKSFTPAEIAYCAGRADKLAGRWAAKEAVIKCFDGTPICFPRRRIEILPAASGAPRVTLLGGDAQGADVQVSITHQAGVAVASAVLEMPDESERPLPAPDALRVPRRPLDAHKGTFGTVVALAGSQGLTGAAYLCSTAAARAGAGLVRLLVAATIYPILAAKCTEVMATPVQEVAPGAIGHSALDGVMRWLEGADVAIVGPGLGADRSTWRLVADLVARAEIPMVLDADALNALAQNRKALAGVAQRGPRVLTPHPGEMARLLESSTGEVQTRRQEAAGDAARRWGGVVVLKGSKTVVAAPDGRVCVDQHEVPALATGGTGDVLAGFIGGLVAQGLEPFEAAVTGVYVHAEAGRRVAGRLGDSGLLASDLLGEAPLVMKTLRDGGL